MCPKFRWSTCISKTTIHCELFFDSSIWYNGEYQRVTVRAYNVKIKRSDDRIFIITANFECPEELFAEYKSDVIKYLYSFSNIEIKEIKKPYTKKS